jgi:hypothetical protein
MPKLELNYFIERINKNSNNKVCKEQMVKLRKVYTGEEPLFFEFLQEEEKPKVVFSYEQANV